ncbi:hypothetical protein [Lysinibacillus sp. G01H]|uniref:hypothetical protein n=1 Tax=Lysinibacillus sp. G01H TaxID=3026425 RepID=UPI00237EB207|nr:hypothetical protein [Lysinibacillus sp. G01H]WDU77558.1 hypothetical protein PSR12_12720 [Lysinibacillus sp. G01H]
MEKFSDITDYKILIHESTTTEGNGTCIRLTKLNNLDLSQIHEDLINYNIPFQPKKFEVLYPSDVPQIEFENPIKSIAEAPFSAIAEFEGNKIVSYKFICKFHNTVLYENSSMISIEESIKEQNVENIFIGRTKVYIHNFFFDKKFSNVIQSRELELKLKFLSAYQGINVYRNNYKIYGHGKEDWLKLAEKRLMKPAENIDNKLTFGYVILDPFNSYNLEEKTNREGFIRNETSKYFHKIIDIIVTQFGKDREEAVKAIKSHVKSLGNPKRPNIFIQNGSGGGFSTGAGSASGGGSSSGAGPASGGGSSSGAGPASGGGSSSGAGPASGGGSSSGAGPVSGGGSSSGAGPASGGGSSSGVGSASGAGSSTRIGSASGAGSSTGAGSASVVGSKNTYTKFSTIGIIDPEIKKNIQSPKVANLVNEVTTIIIDKYPLATGFLLRSLTEVMMDEYLRQNLVSLQTHFKDYIINSDNNIKRKITKSSSIEEKDIPIKTKLMDFKRYLSKTNQFDARSLKHLDYLAHCIDDINLAMHWTDKTVTINQLQSNWQNSIFFIEFICKSI